MIYVDLSQVLSRLDTIISLNSVIEICTLLISLMSLFIVFRIKKGVN